MGDGRAARTVAIRRYRSGVDLPEGWVSVGIDVLRATTTAITAVVSGRRCFPVDSLDSATALAATLENPLLVGELGGNVPFGFHVQNSPAAMARPAEAGRPVILLSTSGTQLLCAAAARGLTYAACLRNVTAQARWLTEGDYEKVVLVAGESRGEFREEDRLCCARIARLLLEAGFAAYDRQVEELVGSWGEAPDDAFLGGHSVAYLSSTGQHADVAFTIDHVDDLNAVFELRDGEILALPLGGEARPMESLA